MSSSPITVLISAALFVGVLVIAFLVLRAMMLWYWRVDRIVALLESMDARLSTLETLTRARGAPPVTRETPAAPSLSSLGGENPFARPPFDRPRA